MGDGNWDTTSVHGDYVTCEAWWCSGRASDS